MFNFDFEDKRFRSWLRGLQYFVLTVLVLAGTVILVLAGQGYDFDRQTGQLIQNGLVLVNSSPENATVLIGGQAESDTTPGTFSLPIGEYDLAINLDGYTSWAKHLKVDGSGVEWLFYPLLIPNELTTTNTSVFLRPLFYEPSPNGSRALVKTADSRLNFSLLNLNAGVITGEASLSVPAELVELKTGRNQNFSFEGWAGDSRHALIKHSRGGEVEYWWFDVEDMDNARNLSRDFAVELDEVRFIDDQNDSLYALVDGNLRQLNLGNDTMSAPIVRSVGRFVLHQDQFVVYIADNDGQTVLGLRQNQDEPKVVLELAGQPKRYRLEFAQFDDIFHVALLDTETGHLKIINNPQNERLGTESADVTLTLLGAKFVSFSTNGQFIMIQNANSFRSYDFDRQRRHSFKLDIEVAAEAKWLDGYHLYANDQFDIANIFEFDGGNRRALIKANPAFDMTFDAGRSQLINLSLPAQGGRVFLQQTALVAES